METLTFIPQSNLMNKLDPTVDSDIDGRGSGGVGVGGTNTSTTGGISSSTNAGPHDVGAFLS